MSIGPMGDLARLRGEGHLAMAALEGRGQVADSGRRRCSLALTASGLLLSSIRARAGAYPGRRGETSPAWAIAGSDASRRFTRHGATRGTAAPRHRISPSRPPAVLPSVVSGVREPAPDIIILVFIAMVQEVQEMVMATIIVLEDRRRRITGGGCVEAASQVCPRKERGARVQEEARMRATSVGVAETFFWTNSAATSTR